MIDMQSKYDNMHKNIIFYVLICINNHVIAGINCMLSLHTTKVFVAAIAHRSMDIEPLQSFKHLSMHLVKVDISLSSN